MTAEMPPLLTVADVAAWRAWLDANEESSDGVWLVLAKKGTTEPTTLNYAQALDEALCSGWIDGQKGRIDDATFRQRFTPRRRASMWSERNIGIVERLTAEGRMRERGQAEIDRAQADGRWQRAYAGAAKAEIPDDLTAALAASEAAAATFATLNAANRYAILHRLMTATNETTRANRLGRIMAMLDKGDTIHPQ